MSEPRSGDDEPSGPNRGTLVALIAVVVLAALGYWAFTAIDHMRKVQNCLDEGRRNCMEVGSPSP